MSQLVEKVLVSWRLFDDLNVSQSRYLSERSITRASEIVNTQMTIYNANTKPVQYKLEPIV